MLSRKDIRPLQTQKLLDAGFLPVSVDYRLCPEVPLADGPMADVRDALAWARTELPGLRLARSDIRVDGDRVVAVGWSTGGHLALSLAWTASRPPEAILAFYCPTDYEDPFWTRPNIPFGADVAPPMALRASDLWEGVYDRPITAYNPPATRRALAGWMAPSDPRSRIALYMNWRGQTLPVLLNGMRKPQQQTDGEDSSPEELLLPEPSESQIRAVSPLAQIRAGNYR